MQNANLQIGIIKDRAWVYWQGPYFACIADLSAESFVYTGYVICCIWYTTKKIQIKSNKTEMKVQLFRLSCLYHKQKCLILHRHVRIGN